MCSTKKKKVAKINFILKKKKERNKGTVTHFFNICSLAANKIDSQIGQFAPFIYTFCVLRKLSAVCHCKVMWQLQSPETPQIPCGLPLFKLVGRLLSSSMPTSILLIAGGRSMKCLF